ncbi:MAG TPA: FecR family protein [Puia sp.]|nr:FecR family protein [Puia sp.]
MQEEKIWNLIAGKLSGEASEQDLQELEMLLRCYPDLHYPMQNIMDLWNANPQEKKEEAAKAFERHIERMRLRGLDFETAPAGDSSPAQSPVIYDPIPQTKRKSWLVWAGLSVLLLAGGVYLYNRTQQPAAQMIAVHSGPANVQNEISTRNGSKRTLFLPDGTQVWMNAGSKITYERNFGDNLREVVLTGEAFFDVVHNAEKPFIIHTAKMDIKVLGTRFSVKSYPNDKTSEASLFRGSIEVSIHDRPNEKIILKPNEKIVVANDDSTLEHRTNADHHLSSKEEPLVSISRPTYEAKTGAVIETSWMEGRLIFQDEEFGDLARQMERWYGISMHFDQPGLEKLRFTGSFQKETVHQALDALKETAPTTPFQYKIVDNQITIYE